MENFIQNLKKAELHLHIEGTLEPEMMFTLAKRNNIQLKYADINAVKHAYQFANLNEFLDLYYQGMSVLITEQDFYDLTYTYLIKAHADNVIYAEIFIDPQGHLSRGVSFSTMINGVVKAIKAAKAQFGIETKIIVCFLRHLSERDAINMLETALPYREHFIGVGLDSSELGHPPAKFKQVFKLARENGFRLVAHAGEEAPAEYIWQALDELGVERIDHGLTAVTDKTLMQRLAKDKIPLTLCPLSNIALKNIDNLINYPVKEFLDEGVIITLNSDDPAYFGGYINQNYFDAAKALNLGEIELSNIAQNSLSARFI